MINIVHQLQQTTRQSLRRLIPALGLPRASYLRWQQHRRAGLPVIGKTPPRDFQSLEQAQPEVALELKNEVAALRHGQQRTHGTGALYQRVRSHLSRRAFNLLVRRHRDELNRQRRDALTRLAWNPEASAAVWAMDPAQMDERTYNLVTDLASRFRFELTVHTHLPARSIAGQLTTLFENHGAPLILKRDNGSNLCAPDVDEVLHAYGVLPLNSPPHYPRYNGSIERAQRELKTTASGLIERGTPLDEALHIAPHLLNTKPRPILGGKTAAAVFLPARTPFQQQFTPSKREEIKNSIEQDAQRIQSRMKTCGHQAHDAAWRQAVQQWLENHGLITVLRPKIVSPLFP